eukprot:Pompholyxophrys_punicea_v1_NODE_396_length_2062_cov_35.491281.p1 type:complete len:135 gc:universal NODE_396_length_2062_cov_35.491281:844-440(-)
MPSNVTSNATSPTPHNSTSKSSTPSSESRKTSQIRQLEFSCSNFRVHYSAGSPEKKSFFFSLPSGTLSLSFCGAAPLLFVSTEKVHFLWRKITLYVTVSQFAGCFLCCSKEFQRELSRDGLNLFSLVILFLKKE